MQGGLGLIEQKMGAPFLLHNKSEYFHFYDFSYLFLKKKSGRKLPLLYILVLKTMSWHERDVHHTSAHQRLTSSILWFFERPLMIRRKDDALSNRQVHHHLFLREKGEKILQFMT